MDRRFLTPGLDASGDQTTNLHNRDKFYILVHHFNIPYPITIDGPF